VIRRSDAPKATAVDRRWAHVTSVLLAGFLLVVLAVLLIWFHSRSQDGEISGLRSDNASQSTQVQHLNDLASAYATAAQDGKTLAGRISAACRSGALSGPVCESASSVAAQPVPSATPVLSEPPRVVVVSPNASDWQQAVNTWCTQHRCSQPPSVQEVQAAMDAWCAGHNECQGPPGKDGARGPGGADGTNGVSVTGASQDTNHHLILTFSDGTTVDAGPLPQGPRGDTGPQGVPGPDYCTANGGTPTRVDEPGGGAIIICTVPPSPAPTP